MQSIPSLDKSFSFMVLGPLGRPTFTILSATFSVVNTKSLSVLHLLVYSLIQKIEVFTLPLLFRADSIGLRVSRMAIFLLFHHSIFPRIFRSWSEHFWPDHSVQRTFPMDCHWTNNEPATEMTRTDGILMNIANRSPTEFRWTWPTEVWRKSDGLWASTCY